MTPHYEKYWDDLWYSRRFWPAFVASVLAHVFVAVAVGAYLSYHPASIPIQLYEVDFSAGPAGGPPAPAAAPATPAPPQPAPTPPSPPVQEEKPKPPPEPPKEPPKEQPKPKEPPKEKPKEQPKPKDTKPKEQKPKPPKEKFEPLPLMPETAPARTQPPRTTPPAPAASAAAGASTTVDPNVTGTGFAGSGLPSELSGWGGNVKRKVETAWIVPDGIRIIVGNNQAIVSFWVDRFGNLLGEPTVVKEASDPELAQSGLMAVKLAAPFPPLPETFKESKVEVHYVFTLAP